jgi:hypothetical protein
MKTSKNEVRALMQIELDKLLKKKGKAGASAADWRKHLSGLYHDDPATFEALTLQLLLEAGDKNWRKPPRVDGPDLFSVAGVTIASYLTRPISAYVDAKDVADESQDQFQKVSVEFATIADAKDDMQIKMRKAAQSSAAAERLAQAVDEMVKRAKGKMSTLIKSVAD